MTRTVQQTYGMRSPAVFTAAKGAEGIAFPELVMGCELEIEGCPLQAEAYMQLVNKLGFSVTTDGSLRGVNTNTNGNVVEGYAFEFISQPMRSDHLAYSLAEFFRVTKFDEKNYSDRCSIHFHVNCTELAWDVVSSVALLYQVTEECLFNFIGHERDSNIYCIPWSHSRLSHDMVARMAEDPGRSLKGWQKYTSLNLLPLATIGTVEFRHMEGNADIKRITQWINIIGSLFLYAQRLQLTSLIDVVKSLNSTSEYESFFRNVFGGHLPYNDKCREMLEAGVIQAKYSLINWKRERKLRIDGSEAPVRVEGQNRFIPWPPVGTTFEDIDDMELAFLSDRNNGVRASFAWSSVVDRQMQVVGPPVPGSRLDPNSPTFLGAPAAQAPTVAAEERVQVRVAGEWAPLFPNTVVYGDPDRPVAPPQVTINARRAGANPAPVDTPLGGGGGGGRIGTTTARNPVGGARPTIEQARTEWDEMFHNAQIRAQQAAAAQANRPRTLAEQAAEARRQREMARIEERARRARLRGVAATTAPQQPIRPAPADLFNPHYEEPEF